MNLDPFEHYTSEQAWAIYQFLTQQRRVLKQRFNKDFYRFQRQIKLMEKYARSVEAMSEEERSMAGIWLESKSPPPF